MADSPLSFVTGLGWETYFQTAGQRYATHNVYLDRLYNLGLIGVLLFTLSYASAIIIARNGIRHAPKEAVPYLMATVIGMLSFMVAMLFADLQGSASYVWAYTALALRIAVAGSETEKAAANVQRPERRWTRDQAKPATRPMSATPKR
jgi:O-antigen ligase